MKNIILCAILLIAAMVNSQTTVTTISPEIKGSGGLSLNGNGDLIIADFGDFLSVPDPDGLPNDVLIMDLGTNNITNYSSGFGGASGNDFDSNGVLLQSDIRDWGVYKIIGGVRTLFTNVGIVAPVGIGYDSNDNAFVCNCGDDTIRKVTPAGFSTLFASGTIFRCPNGITVDENDNLYVTNFSNGDVIKITPAGDTSVIVSTPGGTTGGPSNGHIDYHEPTETLFIASHGSNKIYAARLSNPSNLITIAGSGARGNADGNGSSASFSRPNGVAVSDDGDTIYVNSAVPVTNVPNGPLNPQLIRKITGVQSILAANDVTKTSISAFFYPNPVNEELTLVINTAIDTAEFVIQIIDVQGRLLRTIVPNLSKGDKLEIKVPMQDLSNGMYFISIKDKNKSIFIERIVKE